MRLLKILLIILLLLAAIFYTSFQGDPDKVRALFEQDLGLNLPRQPVTVYRWRDAQGLWQYGNEPPPGVVYETVQVDPDTNTQLLAPLPEGAQKQR